MSGPLVVALVVLLALAVAVAATWLARRIVRHDAAPPQETEAPEPSSPEQALVAPAGSPPPPASEPDPATARAEVEPATATTGGAAPDPVGHVVWGYVLDQDATPIPGSSFPAVSFTDERGQRQIARAGDDGSWSMSGLESGRWYLHATARERKAQELVLDLVPDVPRVRQDFHLLPQPTVKVRLLAPDGRPFWDALPREQRGLWAMSTLAVATREPPGERFTEVFGSVNNPFGVGSWWLNGMMGVQLPEDFWGVVRLSVDPPVSLSLVVYHDVVATQRIEPGQDAATFTLDPATLATRFGGVELQVVDDRGTPLPGAMVSLGERGGFGSPVTSDGDGRVRIEGRPAGLYDLRINARDRAEERREVDLPRGRVLDLGTIALADAVPMRGRAVDPDGNGLEVELRVSALPAPGTTPGFDNRRFGSQADGSFEIGAFGPGRWLLQARDAERGRLDGNAARWMAPSLVVDTRSGPAEDLLVRMQPVSCLVARWTGEDPGSVRLRVFDADGLWCKTTGFYSAAPSRIDLLPGDWRVVAVDLEGAVLDERSVTLGTEDLLVELGPGR